MSTFSLTRTQEQRLKQALLGDEKLGAWELGVINADVYKKRLGTEWFKYKSIINAYAVQAIKANLSADDIFVTTKHGFAVFFFSSSEEKVAATSETMAQELSRLLGGEKVFQDPPGTCSARAVTRAALVTDIDIYLGLGMQRAPRVVAAEPILAIDTPPPPVNGRPASRYWPLWHAQAQ